MLRCRLQRWVHHKASSSTCEVCVVMRCCLVGIAVWDTGTVFRFRAVVWPCCFGVRSYGSGCGCSPAVLPNAHLSTPGILQVQSCSTWTLIRWRTPVCNLDLASSLPGCVVQVNAPGKLVARRSTFVEGLYSGLVTSPFTASPDPGQAPDSPFASRHSQQPVSPDLMEAKLKLLVEAPAAVEDALASLLNHADPQVQVCNSRTA